MKNLFKGSHGLVWQKAFGLEEEPGHFALPACVDFAAGHAGASAFEIFGFEIADKETVGT